MSDDLLAKVQKAYSFDGPALELGALVIDNDAHPEAQVRLPLAMMNRHGLVAGATGTGKTKTLQVMAEQLSAAGVPVFLADIKGDLSGISAPGQASDRATARAKDVGDTDWKPAASTAQFFSLGGLGTGVPVRARVTSFGPVLLAKVLGLNDTQSSSLNLVFHYADQAGLDLDDIADLRAVMTYLVSDEGKADLKQLGGLSAATVGVILRELVGFEDQGADAFFGEPEFDTNDFLQTTTDGKGVVSVLELAAVQDKPALFSSFLMWLLADLFHDLPEVGDLDKPKLVFFFDEAHLLFHDASKEFLDSIAQTVRLIRSKGVGVFFVTQNPTDVTDEVLGQLGNRVQHALRAFTPDDAKALKKTVSTFPKTSYDLEELLTTLGIGEAIVTVLSESGAPTPVAWTRLRPPQSLMAAIDPAQLQQQVTASPLNARYATRTDDESAAEKLAAREQALEQATAPSAPAPTSTAPEPEHHTSDRGMAEAGGAAAGILASPVFKSFARAAASAAGREIARSIFGTAPRRRRR